MGNQHRFRRSFFKLSVLMSGLLVAIYAFAIAPRKVVIPASSQGTTSYGVPLMNGSSVAVSYNVKCYNSAGGVVFTKNNQQLGAKAQAVHGASPVCQNGSYIGTNSSYFSGGMMDCSNTTYQNRAAACPSGYTVCTNTEAVSRIGSVSYSSYWVDFGASVTGNSNEFYFTYNAGTNWTGNYSGSFPSYDVAGPGYHCNIGTTAPTDGSMPGSAKQNCVAGWNNKAVLCCPGPNAEQVAASCEVEILSSNSEEAYLQSPGFKGNSPF